MGGICCKAEQSAQITLPWSEEKPFSLPEKQFILHQRWRSFFSIFLFFTQDDIWFWSLCCFTIGFSLWALLNGLASIPIPSAASITFKVELKSS